MVVPGSEAAGQVGTVTERDDGDVALEHTMARRSRLGDLRRGRLELLAGGPMAAWAATNVSGWSWTRPDLLIDA